MLRRALLAVLQSGHGGALLGWAFARAPWLLPVPRLLQTEDVLAFPHPRPAAATHVVIVPRRRIATLSSAGPDDAATLGRMLLAAAELAAAAGIEEAGYRVVINGGAYQEVGHVHAHLLSARAAR